MNNKYFIWKHVLNTLYEVRIKERSSSLLTFFLIIYAVNAHIRKVKFPKTIRHTSIYLRVCKVPPCPLWFLNRSDTVRKSVPNSGPWCPLVWVSVDQWQQSMGHGRPITGSSAIVWSEWVGANITLLKFQVAENPNLKISYSSWQITKCTSNLSKILNFYLRSWYHL